MKTPAHCLLLFTAGLLLLPACKKDCGGNAASISKIEPPANPPGYEVRLTGTGFTSASVVRFDNSESSKTTLVDGSSLIATIPSGVLGPVEVTVTDGDCIARNDRFEVFADFPSNIPQSPPAIIIPQAAVNYPANFQNAWSNLNDPGHAIFLEDQDEPDGSLGPNSSEFHFGNPFFDSNPITGYLRFNEAARTSDIRIEIDRRSKPGGKLEIYTGVLIDPASVNSTDTYALLLTSQEDGRQLIFLFP